MRAITEIWAQPMRLRRVFFNGDDVQHARATGSLSFPRVELPPTPDQLAIVDALGFPRHADRVAASELLDPAIESKKTAYFCALSQRQYRLILVSAGIEAAILHSEALAQAFIPRLESRAHQYAKFYTAARWLSSIFRDFLSRMRRRPGGYAKHAHRLQAHLHDPRAALVFDRSCILAGALRRKVIVLCDYAVDCDTSRTALVAFCNDSVTRLPIKKGDEPCLQTFIHALFLDVCDVSYSEDPITGEFSDMATCAAKEYFRSREFNPKWANEFRKKFSSKDLWIEA